MFRLGSGSLTPPGQQQRDDRQAGDPGHPDGEIVDRHAGRNVNPRPPPGAAGHACGRRRRGTARGRSRWPSSALLVLAVIAVAAVLPASLVADKHVRDGRPGRDVEAATPYARVPAAAQPVDDRVSFGELEGVAEVDERPPGDIYFVTISEPRSRCCRGGSAARTSREIDVPRPSSRRSTARRPPDAATGRISLQMMRTSTQVAQYVALGRSGYEDAEIVPGDVVVGELVCLEAGTATSARRYGARRRGRSSPATRLLERRRRGADDRRRPRRRARRQGAGRHGRRSTIERQGEGELTVEVELIASPDDPDRTIIGFVPFDTATRRAAVRDRHRHRQIGGPSAGLAFTLTLIDELSRGRPHRRRATSPSPATINLDGTVGAIGGLPQKVSAVRQAGVDDFLVPAVAERGADSPGPAQIAGDDVEIIPVATLDEALAALERLGGDPAARAPADCIAAIRRRRATFTLCGDGHLVLAPGPVVAGGRGRRGVRHERGAASTSRRCATSCAWSPPSWPACRSASGSSSASCAPPRPARAGDAGELDDETVDPPARRGDGAHPADRPRGRRRDPAKAEDGAGPAAPRGRRRGPAPARGGRARGGPPAQRRRRRRRGRAGDGQAAGPRDGRGGPRLPRAGARRAGPPPRAGPPADRAAASTAATACCRRSSGPAWSPSTSSPS